MILQADISHLRSLVVGVPRRKKDEGRRDFAIEEQLEHLKRFRWLNPVHLASAWGSDLLKY
jgi:hypothetical protein